MDIRKSIARRLRSWEGRGQLDPGNLQALEEKVRFLITENIRLNQVIRELIYFNRLKRSDAGAQTKESFDYQWGEIPEGKWMPSNPDFLNKTPDLISKWTHLPASWFQGKDILDAGCGSGRWTYGLLKLGARVTAIDQSLNAIGETKSLIQDLHPAELRQEDLIELRLEKNSYDMVWCFGVAHHTENPIQVIKNLIRAIVPGGYLFMMLYAFPQTIDDYETKASYEEWRQKLSPLSNTEKVDILKKHYPPGLVHGYFDAYSPLINDLFTWEWIQTFFQNEGFEEIYRVPDEFNHYFVARKRIKPHE
jgi:2-polyprenyl-3-methyl-5-hydroxy-6-metoxy-1,4-benzoquinol methylase